MATQQPMTMADLMTQLIHQMGTLINGLTSLINPWENAAQGMADAGVAITNMPQAVATAVTATRPPPDPKWKPAEPAVYKGDPNRVLGFLNEVRLYCMAVKLTNENERMIYTLSRIRGGKENQATIWADGIRTELICVADNNTRNPNKPANSIDYTDNRNTKTGDQTDQTSDVPEMEETN